MNTDQTMLIQMTAEQLDQLVKQAAKEGASEALAEAGISAPTQTDQYLKVSEFAERLKISPATVYGLIKQGKIKSTKLPGASRRIPSSELANHTS